LVIPFLKVNFGYTFSKGILYMPIKASKLALQPIEQKKFTNGLGVALGNIMPGIRPIFYDSENDKIIDMTTNPQDSSKEKPFSDILRKK
jgi:hypothetical protein